MLSDEVIEKVTERLADRIGQANTYILEQMGTNVGKLRKLTESEAHQLVQMMKYGGDYNKILNKLAEITNLNVKDIQDIFEEAARDDYNFAKQFYEYRNTSYIPYDENIAFQNQVKAIANSTANKYVNLMNTNVMGFGFVDEITGETTFKGLQQSYFDLLDEAVLSISQGKETFDQAVSRQIEQMGGSGLRTIYDSTYVDKEGIIKHYTRRLDSAVKMNVKDGLRNLHNESQKIFGEEFDYDGVEITVHSNPAPDHADAQGRQFSIKSENGEPSEWEKLNTLGYAKDYTGKLIDIRHISKKGHISFRPISKMNCYHTIRSIILGVSDPEYTPEELDQINEENMQGFELDGRHYTNYEGTQLQRRLETKIREQKDIQIMGKKAGQSETVDIAQQKISQLTAKYKELSTVSGLKTRMDRMRVKDYRRTNPNTVIDRSKFKSYDIKAPAADYPKYKKDFDFPSNSSLDEYVKQGGKMTDNMATDKAYRNEMFKLAKDMEKLKRPIKEDIVLYSGQDLSLDLSKSKFVISTSIGYQTAYGYTKQYSKASQNMGVVKIYAEKGNNLISTANTKQDHFSKQGEMIIPISEIKNLVKINDYEYILKKPKK